MGDVVMGVWDWLVPEKKCTRCPYFPLLSFKISYSLSYCERQVLFPVLRRLCVDHIRHILSEKRKC